MDRSRSCASSLGRAAAGLFVSLFALTLPLSLLAFAWGDVLFSADEMTDIIAGELVESGALQRLAVESLAARGREQPAEDDIFDFLAPQDLDELLSMVVPPGWGREQIRANLEDFYRWIDDERLVPEITLDIRPIKDQILGGGGAQVVERIVSSWPECGAGQIEQLAREGFDPSQLPPFLCQPPEPLRTSLVNTLVALLERQVRLLPDEVQPGGETRPDATSQDIFRLKRGLRLLRGLARVGWLLPVSALGMITALAVRSWPQLLRWWGAAILGGGLATFVTVFVSGGVVETALESGPMRELSLFAFEPVLRSLVDRLLEAAMGRLFVLAFLTTGLGVILLVSGLWIRRRRTAVSLPSS